MYKLKYSTLVDVLGYIPPLLASDIKSYLYCLFFQSFLRETVAATARNENPPCQIVPITDDPLTPPICQQTRAGRTSDNPSRSASCH